MEGRVHYCSWEQEEHGFRVFVRGRRSWAATGETFQAAIEALEGIVGAATGDGEVQLEFVEGRPDAPQMPSVEYAAIYGTGDCDGPLHQRGLYEGGYCSVCGNPVGERTRERRLVSQLPQGDAALNIGWNPIFSESFIGQLRPDEHQHLEFLEIIPPKRSRRRFYELVGNSVGEFVAKKGMATSAGQCARCGYRNIYHTINDRMVCFLPVTNQPSPPPTCFAAGRAGFLALCLRISRWREILKAGRVKQVRADAVFLIDQSEVENNPKLRLFGESK
jgi:ribosomal protein L37E